MSFSEKVGAFYQRASNGFHHFAVGAKETFAKAATYISETATKVYNAVLPHFQRFKETSLTFVKENKTSIGFVALGLSIGAAIGVAIACLFKGKSQEAVKTSTPQAPTPPVVAETVKKGPTGGVQVLPPGTPTPLKRVDTAALVKQAEAPIPLTTVNTPALVKQVEAPIPLTTADTPALVKQAQAPIPLTTADTPALVKQGSAPVKQGEAPILLTTAVTPALVKQGPDPVKQGEAPIPLTTADTPALVKQGSGTDKAVPLVAAATV